MSDPAATAETVTQMHASMMRFDGDPDALLAAYDAMRAEIPDSSFLFHACLCDDEGIVLVDTCPSREAFDAFHEGEWFRDALARHGLPAPHVQGHPVHVAFAGGERIAP